MAIMKPVEVSSEFVLITDGTKSGFARVVSGTAKYTIAESLPPANAIAIPFDDAMTLNPGPAVYAKAQGKGKAVIAVTLY